MGVAGATGAFVAGARDLPTANKRGALLHSLKPYAIAIAIYLVSRLVVVSAIFVAMNVVPLWKEDLWQSGPHWYDHLLRWDSEWYADIAANGYQFDGIGGRPNDLPSVVFFPLFPLLARLLAQASGISVAHALLALANVAAVLAMLLLYRVARRECGERAAVVSVAFMSFFPGSLFLSAGYSEPLALLFMLSAFAFMQRAHYLPASVSAGLASATRSAGIVLAPVLIFELWRQHRYNFRRFVAHALACLVLATSGVWLYMVYLGLAFGHPLAFAEAQSAWHGATSAHERLDAALTLQPFMHLRLNDYSPAGLDQWIFVVLLAASVLAWIRLSASFGLFSLSVLMLPYLTLSGGPQGLTSMTRYGLLAFPAFIALGDICQSRLWVCVVVAVVFAGMLGYYAALFGQWYWAG